MLRAVGRADKQRGLVAAQSEAGRARMLDRLNEDVVAASSRATGKALWRTWQEFHWAWFKPDVP
eukprot:6829103-Karenia_brevis.AAC.1